MRVPGSLVQDCAVEFLERMILVEERYPAAGWPLYERPEWVAVCITHHVIDYKRRLASRAAHEVCWADLPGALLSNLVAPGRSPEADALAEELGLLVARALTRMPSDQRRLFAQHHLRHLSIASIAEETGQEEGCVAMRLFRIRERLRRLLYGAGLDDDTVEEYLRLLKRPTG